MVKYILVVCKVCGVKVENDNFNFLIDGICLLNKF